MGVKKGLLGYQTYSYRAYYEVVEHREQMHKEWSFKYPLSKDENTHFKEFM